MIDYDPTIEKLQMNAYYYSFNPTGVLLVDRILSAVACAGKAYHNTSEWADPWEADETSQAELIQRAANEAAIEVRRLMDETP